MKMLVHGLKTQLLLVMKILNVLQELHRLGCKGGGEDGLPVWQPIPTLTYEQEIIRAENERKRLLNLAQQNISLWQTKLLMGRKLTENEMHQLNIWVDYIDAVSALDLTSAPDIVWPVLP